MTQSQSLIRGVVFFTGTTLHGVVVLISSSTGFCLFFWARVVVDDFGGVCRHVDVDCRSFGGTAIDDNGIDIGILDQLSKERAWFNVLELVEQPSGC